MSLLFQHPALLGLLALAGVPLLVHLLSRAKPPLRPFPNIEFLRRVQRLASRLRKPKDWLLLALRTLALAAFAAAFAGPLLLSKHAPLPGEKLTLVLLIDRSASMAAKEGAGSRFEIACAEAARILDQTRPALSNIIWIDASPDAVFPDPAPNQAYLSDQLSQASVHAEPGALEAAFQLAARQFANAGGRRELHLISDFQQSAWRDFQPVLPADVTVRLTPVATDNPPNLAVTSLVPVPARPVAGQEMLVQCRVRNLSPESRRASLVLDAGGSRQSCALDLAGGGDAEALFTVRCPAPGLLPLTAEIDADGFPGDDRRHAVVRVRESLRLAIAAPAKHHEAATLLRVAEAIPWLEALPDADPLAPPPADALYLTHWSGDSPAALRQLAAAGTAVLVHPSVGVSGGAIAALLGLPASTDTNPLALEDDGAGWEASPLTDTAAFALFEGGEFGNPLGGRFRQRLRLPDFGAAPGLTIIGRFSDSLPAIVQSAVGDGSVQLINLSLDPADSTWPDQPAFLPAIGEWLRHSIPAGSSESFTAAPGDLLAWAGDNALESASPALHDTAGSALVLTRHHQAGDPVWQSEAAAAPGLYRWLVSDQPVHFTAVNFPESESPLAPLAAPPAWGAGPGGNGSVRLALDQGLPLWPWLLAAALTLVVVEGLVSSLGSRSTETA